MSDHKGAALMLASLPPAKTLIADRGYDSNWFRTALKASGVEPCIPSTKSRKIPLHYDKTLYRMRHKIENMFGRLKDWRRIATRYDRCAHAFFSAICIAAAILGVICNDVLSLASAGSGRERVQGRVSRPRIRAPDTCCA